MATSSNSVSLRRSSRVRRDVDLLDYFMGDAEGSELCSDDEGSDNDPNDFCSEDSASETDDQVMQNTSSVSSNARRRMQNTNNAGGNFVATGNVVNANNNAWLRVLDLKLDSKCIRQQYFMYCMCVVCIYFIVTYNI